MLRSQVLEYIWLDAKQNFRSKVKVNNGKPYELNDISTIPIWNYDGSSTGQAEIQDSEVLLHPKKVYTHSMLTNFPVLVLCDTYNPKTDLRTSHYDAELVFKKYKDNLPMFGLEQEFFMLDTITRDIPEKKNKVAQHGEYYCAIGPQCARTRPYVLDVMYTAIQLGIQITGMNYEVAPGQAELQVCNIGLDACYDLLMVRYLLTRLGERYKIIPNFEPKILNDENGSGCHINFSTLEMRSMTNVKELHQTIQSMCKNLEQDHNIFINEYYGSGNKERLSGTCETCSFKEFKIKKGGRNASIRVPNDGNYFEDRRPSSNIDPYLACSKLLECVMRSQ